MYAVIGMRYHSNIFSAKWGRHLFLFHMNKNARVYEKMELDRYCISLDKLSDEELKRNFRF